MPTKSPLPRDPERAARLIAAAPDLFQALKEIMDGFYSGVFVRDVSRDHEAGWSIRLLPVVRTLQRAEVAIAQVEGSLNAAGAAGLYEGDPDTP